MLDHNAKRAGGRGHDTRGRNASVVDQASGRAWQAEGEEDLSASIGDFQIPPEAETTQIKSNNILLHPQPITVVSATTKFPMLPAAHLDSIATLV